MAVAAEDVIPETFRLNDLEKLKVVRHVEALKHEPSQLEWSLFGKNMLIYPHSET